MWNACKTINYEINLTLTLSAGRVIFPATGTTKFTITDAKLHVPDVTLLAQDNIKLFQQLKLGFKRTINWNKYQSKVTIQAQNPHLEDSIFQGKTALFVGSSERLQCYEVKMVKPFLISQ